ncbi:RNA-binding domain-containing protein [Thalassorhabdomicrobium marinisediminis]|nr:RNA-binding domain-containing protein [Thalassorhabdomicrobium marinisediminis]
MNTLMELVRNSETEWLELKASFYPEGGNFEQGTNADDYRWNVAKAVIALANSIGGVVLLGVADDNGVIGIEASDPDGRRRSKGAEAFRREVVMPQVLCPAKGWKTGRQGNFRLANAALLERLVALEEIPQGEQSVLAIFVDPAPEGYGFVEVEASKDVTRQIYLRKRGAVGQVLALDGDQADVLSTHEAQRRKLAAEIPLLWKQFEEGGLLARSTEELVPDVRRHVAALETRLAPVADQFIPLVAVQRRTTRPNASRKAKVLDDGDNWVRSEATRSGEDCDLLPTAPEPRRGPATELLGRTNQALLIGEGGSGKSRCLAALAFEAVREWKPGQPWPLLVSLSAYSAEGLAGLLATESGIDWQDLAPRVGAGELTLCLDGLNECPDLFYDQCLTEIAGILREYPAARVLLTSRSAQLPPELKLEVFELEAMDRACQSKFLATYLEQPQKAESILEQLHLHDGGSAIAGSPILLRIVAEVARETDEIPNERSKLYCSFLDAWFRREIETSRHGGETLPWDHELTITALAELAFRARQKGSSRIPRPQAHALLIHRLGEDTERFIDWASQGTVLVRNEGRGELAFEHETIQEYLCARYLAARNEDLHPDVLAVRADAKPGIWAMPLAFTFEMLAQPSPALVDSAWRVEPLIVAAGTRSELHHHAKDVADDLWEEAVLNVLLGKDAAAQARAISIMARLPPKYPISQYLLSSLNSQAFWYTALTHATGVARVDRLRGLVCGPDFPWIELLADTLIGCKAWAAGLSPALRAIAGVSPTPTLREVLSSCSVSEFCALRRRKMISAETFVSSWKTALDRSSADRLDLDLLDILRTEKEQVDDVLQDMLPRYRAQLRRIAVEPELSLRVLSILLRGGVVQAEELRERRGFLANVRARMSMMNAIRLAKQGLLRPADIDAGTRARLVYDRKTTVRNIDDAIRSELLNPEDLPTQLRERIVAAAPSPHRKQRARSGEAKFSVAMLSDAKSRMKVNAELAKIRWTVELKRTIPERGYGFVRHPDFGEDIFCLLSKIAATDRNGLREGKVLNVRITTSYDRARQHWSFAVESGHTVE